jgi:AraC-like DNA-binding protein
MRRAEAQRTRVAADVRIGGSLAIPAILRSLDADPVEVLAEAGVDLELFDDPENLISFATRGRLVAHCVARTGCTHFGLLVGQENGLRSLGLIGLLVKYAPDVGTAVRSLVRYMHLHVRSAVTALAVDGGVAALSYDIVEPNVEANDQTGDGAMAAFCNVMRELCGPEWKPVEVCFAHRKPADVGPFRRYFRVPLRFDAEQNAVRFSAYWLNRRMPESDPELRRLLQSQVDALQAHSDDALPDRVRRVLRTALAAGHATADHLAMLLSTNSRSLNRRLNAFGTSFQELLDETRFQIARQMLEDSAMEAGQIAELLGYAAPGVFTRAFRRWSGTTPAQWRAAHKAPQ